MSAADVPCWILALQNVKRLTPREHEVFLLLADAQSNQTMADRLFVTERTVRAHLAQIMKKLGLDSRLSASLASYAYLNEVSEDRRDRQYRVDPRTWQGERAEVTSTHKRGQ